MLEDSVSHNPVSMDGLEGSFLVLSDPDFDLGYFGRPVRSLQWPLAQESGFTCDKIETRSRNFVSSHRDESILPTQHTSEQLIKIFQRRIIKV